MGNNVVPFKDNLPSELADIFDPDKDEAFVDGISSGFAVMSFRGSKWRVKHGGEEHPVLNDDGEPRPSIQVVLLGANDKVSKIWYAADYTEGDAGAPDCMSINGVTPDEGVPSPQADKCAMCQHNQWGSKITPAGKKAKACQDNKRLAIVPVEDLKNEAFGGPVLLRVPAASLQELKLYHGKVKSSNRSLNSIVTQIGFDINAAYPRLVFKPVRPLEEDEMRQLVPHYQNGSIGIVLDSSGELSDRAVTPTEPEEETEETVEEPAVATDPLFSDSEEETAPSPKPKAKKKRAAKKKAAAKAEPVADDADEADEDSAPKDSLDNDLDELLSDLDNLG